jgi:hypothetical protein
MKYRQLVLVYDIDNLFCLRANGNPEPYVGGGLRFDAAMAKKHHRNCLGSGYVLRDGAPPMHDDIDEMRESA